MFHPFTSTAFRVSSRVILAGLFSAIQLTSAHAGTVQTINLEGELMGRPFEGIGAVSAGASSRLLIEYPEPYRNQILDFLFKPNFGAAFQHLKIEIGGDTQSTLGSEPSFARTTNEMAAPDFKRGYEFWFAKEAWNRNSRIYLDALQWGAPGWIGRGNINSQDNADYLVKFLQGAKSVWGLDFHYLGGSQNEMFNGTEDAVRNYIVNTLRLTLDRNGYAGVKIIAADDDYGCAIADRLITDNEYRKALGAVGLHYTGIGKSCSTTNARNCGLPLWDSETWGWDIDGNLAFEKDVLAAGGWHREGLIYARLFNRKYIDGNLTKMNLWAPIYSSLEGLPYDYDATGLIKCQEPWSGHYDVRPLVWAVAHTTQFAEPGWSYLAGDGCGALAAGGSYVTLKKSDGNYSIIIETKDATAAQDITLKSSHLATSGKDIWLSYGDSDSTWFQKVQTNAYPGPSFTLSNVAPNSILTVTTWKNSQVKGSYPTPPASAKFPFPYSETFESYDAGSTPRYITDQQGTFEVVPKEDGTKCLRQQVVQKPIVWSAREPYPYTLVGSKWTNYKAKVDFFIETSGTAGLIGRRSQAFKVSSDGTWQFTSSHTMVAEGKCSVTPNTWHTMAMNLHGLKAQLFIDDVTRPIATVELNPTNSPAGLAGLLTDYNHTRFDNWSVGRADPIPNQSK